MAQNNNYNNYDEDDVDNSAYIPVNFDQSGRLFNGMIKTRNTIEAGIVGFIVYQFLQAVLPSKDAILKLTLSYGIAGLFAVLAIIGYQGDSLSQTIVLIMNYYKQRRKLRYKRIKKEEKTSGMFGNKKIKAKNKSKKKKNNLLNKINKNKNKKITENNKNKNIDKKENKKKIKKKFFKKGVD